MVDALTAGRVHTTRNQNSQDVLSGESWAFERFFSENSFAVGGQALVEDRLLLEDSPARPLTQVLGGFGEAMATVLLFGPRTLEVQLGELGIADSSLSLFLSPLSRSCAPSWCVYSHHLCGVIYSSVSFFLCSSELISRSCRCARVDRGVGTGLTHPQETESSSTYPTNFS